MNIKTNRMIFLLTMIFLLMLTTSIISANELDNVNETNNSHNSDVLNINENSKTSFEGNELYVNHNVEKTGDGSNQLPFKTIKEAIDVANTGKNPVTIFIHSGTYDETNITITNSLVVKSYNGPVTLDANNNGWFFYSNSSDNYLTVHGLIFKNGINYDYYDSTIGGVVKTEGHLDVVNCSFENNFGGTGGAINSHNGANIINSTFKNNKAEYSGAGAYVLYGQTNIVNCTFTNNTAKRQGGAVRIQGNTYIENSTFTDNYAGLMNYAGNGGAVRVTDGNLTIESSIFKNNSARFEGGAVSAGDDNQYSNVHYSFNVNNCTFTDNKARHGAGIIANDGVIMTNSVLCNNSVPESISAKYGQGAGLYVLNGETVLVGNIIANNTNPYNRDCNDIYSYEGNLAEKDNQFGANTKIKTNNGKKTDNVKENINTNINKPDITIKTGETPKQESPNNPTDQNNNEENQTKPNNNATNSENTQNNPQNPVETNESSNPIEEIFEEITNNINNIKDQISSNDNKNTEKQNKKVNNQTATVKTNSTTKQTSSSSDIGKTSQKDSKNSQSSDSAGANGENGVTAHEISAIKSVVSNEYAIPAIILIIIVVLAFVIGYMRKRER